MSTRPPLVLQPHDLEARLGSQELLVVDLSQPASYAQNHIPGAVSLDYGKIVANRPPSAGLLPDTAHLSGVCSHLGIGRETHVVAYDDEGGGKASRFLWTLEVLGHTHYSLLDGGLFAWANEQYPLDNRPAQPRSGVFTARFDTQPIADAEHILRRLADPDCALIDARSIEEYAGGKRFASRGGHIPGAVHWDWTHMMDRTRNLRLRPAAELRRTLAQLGVSPEQEVITYCQTHHRSSLTFIVLKSLQFPRIKGYPGSWSDWGNRTDTPVEHP